MAEQRVCQNCGAADMKCFYETNGTPVHSVMLLATREEALRYPVGDIRLGVCESCGFISNMAFDASLQDYSAEYEATQSCSPTFNRFHKQLAQRLVDRYDLHHKEIIEIGCGQGEFLTLLCDLGHNWGMGFDPAYRAKASNNGSSERLKFVADYYSDKYRDYRADLICCKMTLEHIAQPREFLMMVRRIINHQRDTVLFFQVPNAAYVLRDAAFWDIYYEHCSYFTTGSLSRLFRQTGFDILDLSADYEGQYIMIEARPAEGPTLPVFPPEDDLDVIKEGVAFFSRTVSVRQKRWKQFFIEQYERGKTGVIWGGGSKGVAFLISLGVTGEVSFVVDINPLKHGTYMAGSGHEIVSAQYLLQCPPDYIIVMNPVYRQEISEMLDSMGLRPEVLTV